MLIPASPGPPHCGPTPAGPSREAALRKLESPASECPATSPPEAFGEAPQKSHKSGSRAAPHTNPHGHDGIPRHTPALMLK